MRFGTTAYLFTGEAEPDGAAKGLAHPADTYSLSGSLVGNVWKLTFRNGDESGTLNLPLPDKDVEIRSRHSRWADKAWLPRAGAL